MNTPADGTASAAASGSASESRFRRWLQAFATLARLVRGAPLALGFAAAVWILAPATRSLAHGPSVYGFRSLLAFKAKFQPEYFPLYMCYPDPAALPAIGNAIGRAYLPHTNAAQMVRLSRKLMS